MLKHVNRVFPCWKFTSVEVEKRFLGELPRQGLNLEQARRATAASLLLNEDLLNFKRPDVVLHALPKSTGDVVVLRYVSRYGTT